MTITYLRRGFAVSLLSVLAFTGPLAAVASAQEVPTETTTTTVAPDPLPPLEEVPVDEGPTDEVPVEEVPTEEPEADPVCLDDLTSPLSTRMQCWLDTYPTIDVNDPAPTPPALLIETNWSSPAVRVNVFVTSTADFDAFLDALAGETDVAPTQWRQEIAADSEAAANTWFATFDTFTQVHSEWRLRNYPSGGGQVDFSAGDAVYEYSPVLIVEDPTPVPAPAPTPTPVPVPVPLPHTGANDNRNVIALGAVLLGSALFAGSRKAKQRR